MPPSHLCKMTFSRKGVRKAVFAPIHNNWQPGYIGPINSYKTFNANASSASATRKSTLGVVSVTQTLISQLFPRDLLFWEEYWGRHINGTRRRNAFNLQNLFHVLFSKRRITADAPLVIPRYSARNTNCNSALYGLFEVTIYSSRDKCTLF